MTSTTQRPQRHTDEEFDKEHRKSNGLIITVVVLAILLLALGGWVIYDANSSDSTDVGAATTAGAAATVPANVEGAIADYIFAWESQNGTAFREAVTDNFVINEYIYFDTPTGLELRTVVNEDDIDFIADFRVEPANTEPAWVVERGDDVVITGDGPWYVSFAESWGIDANLLEGTATYMVAEVDGVTKVANHYWIGVSKLIEF